MVHALPMTSSGVFALVMDVLRRTAEHGRFGEDDGALADRCRSVDDDMAHQAHIVANPDLGADVAERADFDIQTDFRSVLDDGRGVDAGRHAALLRVR